MDVRTTRLRIPTRGASRLRTIADTLHRPYLCPRHPHMACHLVLRTPQQQVTAEKAWLPPGGRETCHHCHLGWSHLITHAGGRHYISKNSCAAKQLLSLAPHLSPFSSAFLPVAAAGQRDTHLYAPRHTHTQRPTTDSVGRAAYTAARAGTRAPFLPRSSRRNDVGCARRSLRWFDATRLRDSAGDTVFFSSPGL